MIRMVGARWMMPLLVATWLWGGAAPIPAIAGHTDSHALTLDEAVTRAAASNRLVTSAMAASRSAEAAHRSARADLFAKASAEYTYTRFKEQPYMWVEGYEVSQAGTITGLQSYQKPVSDHDLVEWNITLTQPLFTGFALTTRSRLAELGVRSSQVDTAIARQDAIKQARLAFVNALLAAKMVDVATAAESSLAAHAENAAHFYDQGMIPYNDQLQANVALADATQQRVSLTARQEVAIAALNGVLDLPINRQTVPIDLDDLPQTVSNDPAQLTAQALDQRPELDALALARRQLEQSIVLAKSSRYPTVSLFGQYRQKGEDLAATDNSYDNGHNALVGLVARWTFFEWGKTGAETARIQHEIDALDERLAGVIQSIRLEVKDAFSRLVVARANLRTAEAALDQADENLRIVNTRYGQQMATSTDVLDANTKQTQARANYYGAVYGCHSAMAELDRAVGRMPPAGEHLQTTKRNPTDPQPETGTAIR